MLGKLLILPVFGWACAYVIFPYIIDPILFGKSNTQIAIEKLAKKEKIKKENEEFWKNLHKEQEEERKRLDEIIKEQQIKKEKENEEFWKNWHKEQEEKRKRLDEIIKEEEKKLNKSTEIASESIKRWIR